MQAGQDCRIRIRTFCDDSTVTLQVVDSGIGIDEVTEAHLFEPFFRTRQSVESGKDHGTGLGLAIAARAVQINSGEISALNQVVDGITNGLIIRIILPV